MEGLLADLAAEFKSRQCAQIENEALKTEVARLNAKVDRNCSGYRLPQTVDDWYKANAI